MRNEEKSGFSNGNANPGADVEAALKRARAQNPDMTPEGEKMFRLAHEMATAGNPAPDPRREAERQKRGGENNTPKKNSLWQNGLASLGNSLKALPFGIGAAITGAEHLYQNSKTFRYSFLATTLPFWAFPKYSWKAVDAVIHNGPGGLKGILRTAKNTTVGTGFLVASTVKLAARLGLVSFLAVTGMRTLTDMSEGRGGAMDSLTNAGLATYHDAVQLLGGLSRWTLPRAEKAYGVAKNTVVSGVDSVDDVVSSGANTIGGAASSVGECVENGKSCGAAIGDTVLHTGGNILSALAGAWLGGYHSTIKWYYSTAVPAVGKFAWDNTVCNVFNCQSAPAAPEKTSPATRQKPALPDAEADQLQRLLHGEKDKSTTRENHLANLDYTWTGSRYVSVCTLAASDRRGYEFPGMAGQTERMSTHNDHVGEVIEAMKSDPSSLLARAVTGDRTSHVVIVASPFNSGAATADVYTQSHRIRYTPVAKINGVDIPYLCREYAMSAFLKGTGINPFKIPQNPTRTLFNDAFRGEGAPGPK